jgi:desulfoferrodoxin-like iron-binding protein
MATMEKDRIEESQPDWDFDEWERVLTLHVGTAYACRICGNVVMVTKGGVGILDLVCCGIPMTKALSRGGEAKS